MHYLDGGTASEKALDAYSRMLSEIPEDSSSPVYFDIETAYFDLSGWLLIQDKLSKIDNVKVRILLGSEMKITNFQLKEYLNRIKDESNELVIDKTNYVTYLEMLNWFNNSNIEIEIRMIKSPMLHSKTSIFYYGDTKIKYAVGSANLTKAGLVDNIETVISGDDKEIGWNLCVNFEEKWSIAEPVEMNLVEIYSAKSKELTIAELIKNTFNTANVELLGIGENDFNLGDEWLEGLRQYQKDAAKAIRNVIYNSRYRGMVLADDTGLGKSYIAMSIIAFNALYTDNDKKTLLVCPASIKTNWRNTENQPGYLDDMVKFFDNIAIKKSASKDYLDIESFNALEKNVVNQEYYLAENKYSLIIIDEAHKIKSRDASWWQSIRQIIKNNPNAKILMMTATPYNNSVTDLYALFDLLMTKEDEIYWMNKYGFTSFADKFASLDKKIKNNIDFSHGGTNMWLTDLIKTFVIRRSVKYIKQNYKDDLKDFPELNTMVKKYNLFESPDEDLAFFKEVEKLDFSYYKLFSNYYKGDKKAVQDKYKVLEATSFVKVAFFKRLDSSLEAFKLTLTSYENKIKEMLHAIGCHKEVPANFLKPINATLPDEDEEDDDEAKLLIEIEPLIMSDGNFQIKDYENVLLQELEIITSLITRISLYSIDNKAILLESILDNIHASASKTGNSDDFKCLVFSEFKDTSEKIAKTIVPILRKGNYRILGEATGGLKYGNSSPQDWQVSGSTSSSIKKDKISKLSPLTNKVEISSMHETNILFTTDVLSEGVNLQQVKNIIQYDLPWNHAKSIQRVGRCLRVGSKHSIVDNYVLTFENLSAFLTLIEKLENKINANANIMGSDINPVSETALADSTYVQNNIINHGFIIQEENKESAFSENTDIYTDVSPTPVYSGCYLGGDRNSIILTASLSYKETKDLVIIEYDLENNTVIVDKNFNKIKLLSEVDEPFDYEEITKYIFSTEDIIKDGVASYLVEITNGEYNEAGSINFNITVVNFARVIKKDTGHAILPDIEEPYGSVPQIHGDGILENAVNKEEHIQDIIGNRIKSKTKDLKIMERCNYKLINQHGYQMILKYLITNNSFNGASRIIINIDGNNFVAKINENGEIIRHKEVIKSLHALTFNLLDERLSDDIVNLYKNNINNAVWSLWYPKSQSYIGDKSLHDYILSIDEKDFEAWVELELLKKKDKYARN